MNLPNRTGAKRVVVVVDWLLDEKAVDIAPAAVTELVVDVDLAVVVVDIEFAVVVVYIVVHVAVADDFVVFGPVVVDWVLSV